MVKPKKHILFIVENNPVPHDVRVWGEAMSAKEFGYDVTVISPKNEKANKSYERINGIDIYRHFIPFEADGKWAFLVEYANAIIWELLLSLWVFLKKPFHFIHSANPPDHVFLIAVLYKVFGVKYIFDHHDICPENYVAKFHRKDLFYRLLRLMEKLTFKTADIVISTNQSYKKIAMGRGKKKGEDVFVVRNGPNLSKVIFLPPNDALKNGFKHLVAYVGVIGNQEGIDNLLRAVEYIVYEKNVTDTKFMIIGTGPHLDSLVRLSHEMRLKDYVKFTGYIPYRDFYEILSTADVCVNPEYRNPFTDRSTMLKIMDYMTMGKPIVMFETTEGNYTAREAAISIKENDDIIFADAILDLLNDRDKREKMGQFGRKRIDEQLNWDIQKKNLKNAYTYLEQKYSHERRSEF